MKARIIDLSGLRYTRGHPKIESATIYVPQMAALIVVSKALGISVIRSKLLTDRLRGKHGAANVYLSREMVTDIRAVLAAQDNLNKKGHDLVGILVSVAQATSAKEKRKRAKKDVKSKRKTKKR